MPFAILERSLVLIYISVSEVIVSPDGIGLMPDLMI